MSADTARGLVFGALVIHGLGHGGALGALIWMALRPSDPTGGWQAARSWLLPALPAATATPIAGAFWIVAMLGFVVAALSFWGIGLPGEAWRSLAIGSAIVSLVGITLFFGTWPPFNTLAALAVNIAVLVSLLWLRWPAQAAT
ncbi:MAG TPA: hypothetical protein VIS26_05815 [Candidatus Limnocylindria bacterium]|jgi:hypothetical protein